MKKSKEGQREREAENHKMNPKTDHHDRREHSNSTISNECDQ
jgi:hypothetical protein